MKLRRKIVIIFLALLFVPLAIFVSTTFYGILNLSSEKRQRLLYSDFKVIHLELENFFSKRAELIKTYANTPAVRSMDYENRIMPFYESELEKKDLFVKLLIGTKESHFYLAKRGVEGLGNSNMGYLYTYDNKAIEAKPKSISKRLYWQHTISSNRFFASEPMIALADGAVQFYLANSIVDDDGKVIGMTSGSIPYSLIQSKIDEIVKSRSDDFNKNSRLVIVNNEGRYIYHPDPKVMIHVVEKDGEKEIVEQNLFERYKGNEHNKSIVSGKTGGFPLEHYEFKNCYARYSPIGDTGYSLLYYINEDFLNSTRNTLITATAIVVAVLIVLIIVLAIIFANSIIRPISNASVSFKQFAEGEGDLTKRLNIESKDEVGELALGFNSFVGKLSRLMRDIIKTFEDVSSRGKTLQKHFTENESTLDDLIQSIYNSNNNLSEQQSKKEETEEAFNRQRAKSKKLIEDVNSAKVQTDSIKSSIEDQVSAISEVSSTIEEQSANISSISDSTKKTNTKINELAKATEENKSTIDKTSENIKKMTDSLGVIEEFANLISDISSQTNLLAMNASIEAAHAGEYGRGFAVVAEEIRKLADKSNAETEKIKNLLNDFISYIKSVENSFDVSSKSFDLIVENVSEIRSMTNQINTALDEQSSGNQEMLKAFQSIQEISQTLSERRNSLVESIDKAAQEAAEFEENLSFTAGTFDKFSRNSDESNKSLKEILSVIQNVIIEMSANKELVDELEKNIEIMNEGLSHFKTDDSGNSTEEQRRLLE